MPTLHELAREAGSFFETATRDDDSSYVRLRDGRPEWVFNLCYDSHDDFLPDDWRYACIASALERIAETDEDEDLDDERGEWADSEVDVYTGARFAWLASHLLRQNYVDEAVSEFGFEFSDAHGIVDAIGLGQYAEADEVFGLVLESLRARLDEVESEEEDAGAGDA